MAEIKQKKCLILANGRPPAKSVITYLMKSGYSTLICADGGANSACKMELVPDFIVGDLDSINENTLKQLRRKSIIKKISGQNDTDVEKCLNFAIKKGFEEAILVGVTGDRLDHSFCNLGIVLKFFEKIAVSIIAENSFLSAYKGNMNLLTKKGETISLYGFDQKTKITGKGLKYPLNNTSLPFGQKESTSNVAVADKVDLNIKGGRIFIVRDFKFMRKNGFI